MRPVVLTTAVVLSLGAATALAQSTPPGINPNTGARPGNDIGTNNSLPLGNNASNIAGSDTRSVIAPRLPQPTVGDNASPKELLMYARQSLGARQTGRAQQALEMAQTRLLSRVVAPSQVNAPDANPAVSDISAALQALGRHDMAQTNQMIDSAMSKLGS